MTERKPSHVANSP